MADWMISGNPQKYDVIEAFRELKRVDWGQSANFQVDDIVYIYVSAPVQAIKFKCRVNAVDKKLVEAEDSEFVLDEAYGTKTGEEGRYAELELLEEFFGPGFGREELAKHGFKSPLGPVHIPDTVKKYIESLPKGEPEEGRKRYTVNQAIWIAAAVYAYRQCERNDVKISDVYLTAPRLQKIASEFTANAVQPARIHHHCNGDHEKPSHRFLRRISGNTASPGFRLTAKGEFHGDREVPEYLDWNGIIEYDGMTIRLQELLDFERGKYADFIAQNVVKDKGGEIDFIGVMKYLDENLEVPYSSPDAEGIEPKERQRLLAIKAKGQAAVAEMKKMAELCKKKFQLDKCEPMVWLDGTNIKTRKYLWAQMKYGAYADNPISISIFVEISPHFHRARFRYSLGTKNDSTSGEQMKKYHSFLDIPISEGSGLTYASGTDELAVPDALDVSAEEMKALMENGTYKYVQLCRIVEPQEELDNRAYEQIMLEAVEALLPYYEYVIDYEKPGNDGFWPSLAEYDPGISAGEYERMLTDESVVKRNWTDILYCLCMMGGEGSCKQIAARYGKGAPHYNTNGINIARAMAKETGCPRCKGDQGENKYWPVLFYGKDMPGNGEEGVFCYKMREPLMEAVKNLIEKGKLRDMSDSVEFDKNLILYGPPGTGKTYHSAICAVAICDGKNPKELEGDYNAVMKRYHELKAMGRVAFTTFHQSYGYEEFIEGIRPVINDKDHRGDISYTIEPGVFRRFCEQGGSRVTFDEAWDALVAEARAKGNKYTFIRRTGTKIKADLVGDRLFQVNWTGNGKHNDISKDKVKDLYENTTYESRKQYSGDDGWLFDAGYAVIDALITTFGLGKTKAAENKVFIIDEINRGNISRIFGELITLIEKSKRKGAGEAASAILPYSGEEFSVPDNIYILGTMNTADRSIALMDTALRRRFRFIEMMPDPDVLKGITVEGLNISAMLKIINRRIEFLYDREHTIGHAFFIDLKEDASIEKLASVFSGSVIPLLQEYFYEDYRKIQLVLGDNGKSDDGLKFIKDVKVAAKDVFVGNVEDVMDLPEKRYEINPEALHKIESYKAIAPGL